MERLHIDENIKKMFKSRPDLLIFDGYASYSDKAEVYRDGDDLALVLKDGDTNMCCFSSKNGAFADEVTAALTGKIKFCGVPPEITAHMEKKYDFVYKTPCFLYVWNGEPLTHKNTIETRPLRPEFAKMVSDGTHYHAPEEEIVKCLSLHPSAAVYIGDSPVCWCLCHAEKSLGMLYTLPEHRRKGYALEVMTALTNAVIARGDIPFAYIVTDNIPSRNLAPKYNLFPASRADYFLIEK